MASGAARGNLEQRAAVDSCWWPPQRHSPASDLVLRYISPVFWKSNLSLSVEAGACSPQNPILTPVCTIEQNSTRWRSRLLDGVVTTFSEDCPLSGFGNRGAELCRQWRMGTGSLPTPDGATA